jgi:hypothetical protein
MSSDGSGESRLTNDVAVDTHPAWSPSGTQLAWMTERDGNPEIYRMDFDLPPTNLTNLSNAPSAVDDEPDWFESSVPSAPRDVSAFAGPAQATVVWSPPLTYGGSAITAYTVMSNPDDGVPCVWSAGPLQCTVTGLTNETGYSFTVTATNVTGTGPSSTPSSIVTPNAKPRKTSWPGWSSGDGPRKDSSDVFVTTQGDEAVVSFPAAVSQPGDPVVTYTVTAQPGGTSASGPVSPITVTGLERGTAYTFVVEAVTAGGSTATLGRSAEVVVVAARAGNEAQSDDLGCADAARSSRAARGGPSIPAPVFGMVVLPVLARRRPAGLSRAAARRAKAASRRQVLGVLAATFVVAITAATALGGTTDLLTC